MIVEAFALQHKKAEDGGVGDPVGQISAIHDNIFSRSEFQPKEGEQPIISFGGKTSRNEELLKRANWDPRDQVRKFFSVSENQTIIIQARPRLTNVSCSCLTIRGFY